MRSKTFLESAIRCWAAMDVRFSSGVSARLEPMTEEEPFNLAASEVQCRRQPWQWERRGCGGSAQLRHFVLHAPPIVS